MNFLDIEIKMPNFCFCFSLYIPLIFIFYFCVLPRLSYYNWLTRLISYRLVCISIVLTLRKIEKKLTKIAIFSTKLPLAICWKKWQLLSLFLKKKFLTFKCQFSGGAILLKKRQFFQFFEKNVKFLEIFYIQMAIFRTVSFSFIYPYFIKILRLITTLFTKLFHLPS